MGYRTMRKLVFILLVTEQRLDGTAIGVGPAFWNRLEAQQQMHSMRDRGMTVQIVEREVRGEMPQMTARPAVPAHGE